MALTKATHRMIEGASVNVKDFGAVGDGVTAFYA
jgi:polygalacturonase